MSWEEIRRWRREQRARLIARRQAIPQDERRRLQPLILMLVEQHFPELANGLVGFYWPFRGEIGIHPLVRRLVERGARAALPVVVEKNQPLEFWAWRPGAPLRRGVWDIPIPAERQVVRPTALLVPLVGFDRRGYRLGYGGGYYDRTLAAMDPKPLTIGVGYDFGRLETIHPQPHDIPMDAIVTEASLVRPRPDLDAAERRPAPFADVDEDPNSRATFASPPCFMHELDSSGTFSRLPHPRAMTMPQPDPRPTSRLVSAGAPGLSDYGLVERVRAGDAAAFELIMRRHNRRLFRLAGSVLRHGVEAEDVVQETYVQAFAKLDDFRGPEGFSAWLARIVYNEALGRVRGRDRVVSLHDCVSDGDGDADVRRIETMTSHHPDPEHLTGNGELRRMLEAAIDALPDDFRAVFVLRAVEGMSVAETAEALSIPPETVKTRFHRARHRLQQTLGACFEALMPAAFEFGGARCDRIVAAVLARLGPALEAARHRATRPETVAARWPVRECEP